MTEVARESISAAGNIASELVSSTTSLPPLRSPNRPGSIQLIRKTGASNRSLPADATTTLINIDSNGSASDSAVNKCVTQSDLPESEDTNKSTSNQDSTPIKEDSNTEAPATTDNTQTVSTPEKESETNERPTSTWFGWFGLGRTSTDKPSSEEGIMGKSPDTFEPRPATEEPQTDPESSKASEHSTETNKAPEIVIAPDADQQQQKQNDTNVPIPPKRSWMQMWGTTNVSQSKESQEETLAKEPRIEQDEPMEQENIATSENQNSEPDKAQEIDLSKRASGPSKSSGWAFWSRDVSNTEQKQGSESHQEPGELVVSGQPKVQSNSEDVVAQVDNAQTPTSTIKSQHKSQRKSIKSVDYKNAKSAEVVEDTTNTTTTAQASAAQLPAKAQTSEVTASTKLESVLTNQLLPSFKDTFALQESPSWLQTLGRMIYSPKDSGNRHVFALRDPPRPKKALAIGVHGYFPAPYLRTVLGQPTGTSLKFSTMAAKAIHQWADSHGYHCDVEKIALEGEGRIAERVDLLWKLLLRWIEEIRKAEFIMFACHSQGVPVTIMLVAKLIAFGCLDAARVGICAMAGVNLGPFPDYKSRFIGGSAGELFDFAHPTTKVSKDYEAALKTALEFGVRISYVGSIDDQLVSLEVCRPPKASRLRRANYPLVISLCSGISSVYLSGCLCGRTSPRAELVSAIGPSLDPLSTN